jgi:Fe-S oxidoreductase
LPLRLTWAWSRGDWPVVWSRCPATGPSRGTHGGKQIGVERVQETLATGATHLAVACPFGHVMLDDSLNQTGRDEELEVIDIATLVLDAIMAAPNQEPESRG